MPDDRFYFVSNELCVVLKLPADVDAMRYRDETAPAVVKALNQKLTDAGVKIPGSILLSGAKDIVQLQSATRPSPGAAVALARVRRTRRKLQPATQPGPGAAAIDPWVLFPDPDQPTVLHFFEVGKGQIDPDVKKQAARCQFIFDLVSTFFNKTMIGNLVDNITLDSAAPNWYVGAAADANPGDGSPGGLPKAVPPPAEGGNYAFQFQFDNPILKDIVKKTRAKSKGEKSGVIVAVLDTSPTKAEFLVRAAKVVGNALLQDVIANVKFPEDPPAPNAADFGPVGGVGLNWVGKQGVFIPPEEDLYRMPDHGVFVAGIVQDIAPTAKIHLIRVLNEYGLCDSLAVAGVLAQLPGAFGIAKDGKVPMVVNLSLHLAMPPDKIMDRRFPGFNGLANPNMLHNSIHEAIGWLGRQGRVLVVAAAGNENKDDGITNRPVPALPARYEETDTEFVIGVASVKKFDPAVPAPQASDFSNMGNVLGGPPVGIATFGGNADSGLGGPPRVITKAAGDTEDAVVGLWTFPTLPTGSPPPYVIPPPPTGWVYWVGTSFATPIISAVAADLWGDPATAGLTPAEIITKIRSFAVQPVNNLNVGALIAYQT